MIIDVMPYAIGVFASPLPVIIAIVMLFTDRPKVISAVYIGTWTVGVLLATVIFIFLARFFEQSEDPRGWVPWLRVVLGLLLLFMAFKAWRGRNDPPPAWLSSVMQADTRQAFRLGVLLSIANPKELVMALAAGVAIGTSGVGVGAAAVATLVFLAVGAASVILPFVIFIAGGQRALRSLESARGWLQENSVVVAAVVLAFLGLFLILGGLAKL